MVANRVPVSARRDVRCTQDTIELGTKRKPIRFGLDWMNARSKSEFGHVFMECTPEQQKNLLEELAYKAKFKRRRKRSAVFSIDARLHGRWLLHDKDWAGESGYPGCECLAVHAGLPAHERSRARTFAGPVASKAPLRGRGLGKLYATKTFDVIVVGREPAADGDEVLCERDFRSAQSIRGRARNCEDYKLHRQVYDLKYRGYGNPLRFEGKRIRNRIP